MIEEANPLCTRVRERCKLQCWHGSDIDARGAHYTGSGRYELFLDSSGNAHVLDRFPRSDLLATGFEYPQASAAQLHETEQALGFPLPAALRALYTQVANGGFGPGYGIIGCIGRFGDAGNLVEGYQFHVTRQHLIDLDKREYVSEMPETYWPRFLVPLCDLGEAVVLCLDGHSGRIVRVRPSTREFHIHLEVEAFSVEDWLDQWLKHPIEVKVAPEIPVWKGWQ
jgi:hypothetical protein